MIPESQEKSLPCKNPHVWGCRERGNQIEKAEKEREVFSESVSKSYYVTKDRGWNSDQRGLYWKGSHQGIS